MEEYLQKKVADMLEFYEELGLGEFYVRRSGSPKATALSDGPPAGDTRVGTPTEQSVSETGSARPGSALGQTPPSPRSNHVAVLQTAIAHGPGPQVLSLFDAPSPTRAARENETLEMIREDLGDCHRCRLAAGRHTIVFGQGNAHAELVFVGEGPGADEDAQGLPFVGRAGQLLNRMIQFIGMKREEVYICNVVKCRPPGNRTPLPDEIEMCSPFLLRQIAVIRPRLVCCLGAPAVKTLLGIKEGITKIRGRFYDFQGTQALATFHPAYILRNPREEKVLREDFQKIAEFLKMPR